MHRDRNTPPSDSRSWRDEDADTLPRAGFRGSGLVALAAIVLVGLLPAAYYQFARPRMEAAYRAEVEAAPTTSSGRLEKWFEFGAAMIHHRIARVGRFSEAHPWIVTHAVRTGEGPNEVTAFGVDTSRLAGELSHLDGLTVVVDLPEPGPLGPLRLEGERARFVPVLDPGEAPPDPAQRLGELALWFLEGLPDALAEDIEGASLELRIGGRVVLSRRERPTPAASDQEAGGPVPGRAATGR